MIVIVNGYRCSVTYGRKRCEPFKTGIEGARCALGEGHDGEHAARFVETPGETPADDVIDIFKFHEVER